VALVCTHCGTPLPKDDARYCNNCGMLVPSHPFSPQSLSASSQSSPGQYGNEKSWKAMREQNAQQPPTSPLANSVARQPEKGEPPSWMNQLENEVRRGRSFEDARSDRPVAPTPLPDQSWNAWSLQADPVQEDVKNRRVTETPPDSWSIPPLSMPEKPREEFRNNRVTETPTVSWPVAPIAKRDAPPDRDPRNPSYSASAPQLDFPVSEPPPRSASLSSTAPNAPARELRVKVWEQDETTVRLQPEGRPGDRGRVDTWEDNRSDEKRVTVEDQGFDDLPTGPLVANAPASTPEGMAPQRLAGKPDGKAREAHFEAVEKIDTVRMAAQAPIEPASRPIIKAVPQQPQEWPSQRGGGSIDRNQSAPGRYPSQAPLQSPSPIPSQTPTFVRPVSQPGLERSNWTDSANGGNGTNNRSAALSFSAASAPTRVSDKSQALPRPVSSKLKPPRRKKSRKPLVILTIVLLLLIIGGGLGAWIVIDQPFTVASVTQPQQNFSDSQLGFSLHYPNGWSSQTDNAKATVHFTDSSQTDLVNVVMAAANGGNAGQYIQQEASQLGMTGLQTGQPVTFAGVTWQQLKGTQLIKGATYTEMLYVSVHNSSYYTIMQLAPQGTYTQEDQIAFAGMRSSFQFV